MHTVPVELFYGTVHVCRLKPLRVSTVNYLAQVLSQASVLLLGSPDILFNPLALFNFGYQTILRLHNFVLYPAKVEI